MHICVLLFRLLLQDIGQSPFLARVGGKLGSRQDGELSSAKFNIPIHIPSYLENARICIDVVSLI